MDTRYVKISGREDRYRCPVCKMGNSYELTLIHCGKTVYHGMCVGCRLAKCSIAEALGLSALLINYDNKECRPFTIIIGDPPLCYQGYLKGAPTTAASIGCRLGCEACGGERPYEEGCGAKRKRDIVFPDTK